MCCFSKQLVIKTPRAWDRKKGKTTDEESDKELIDSPIVQRAWEAFCGNLIQEVITLSHSFAICFIVDLRFMVFLDYSRPTISS